MNKKNIYAGTAAALLLLMGACDIMTVPESGRIPVSDGKAAVRVNIGAAGIPERTVLPNAALDDVDSWELLGGQSDTETPFTEFSGNGDTIYLEPGTWNFTLQGYNDDSLILRGTITDKAISLDELNTLNFTVKPVFGDQGSIKITINLPAGHSITQVKVFKDGSDLNEPLAPDGNTVVFEAASHAAGDYFYSFRLYKDSDLYGVVSELVQVRQNLSSEKTYTLNETDLNLRYSITYVLNNGQLESGVDNPGQYQYTDKDFTLPTPARTGYTFGGWYDNDGFTGSQYTTIPQLSTGNKTFYAKWTVNTYTVDFNANGGIPVPGNQTITHGDTVSAPMSVTKTGYDFGGWYTEAELTTQWDFDTNTVTANTTLYAEWQMRFDWYVSPSGNDTNNGRSEDASFATVNKALQAIQAAYTTDWPDYRTFSAAPARIVISGSITETGGTDGMVVISETGANPIYTAYPPIILKGKSSAEPGTLNANSSSRVLYIDKADVTLSDNLTLTGGNISANGGGVYVASGIFNMEGGTIKGNTASGTGTADGGGGVYVNGTESIFNMIGGTIGGDVSADANHAKSGGGVYFNGSTFTIRGGTIKSNIATTNGGGVYVAGGEFTMSGAAVISSNTADISGGGVYVNAGTFAMNRGTISGNTATTGSGGGVLVDAGGTFTMSGGTIGGAHPSNTATGGGGVYVAGGEFTMSGEEFEPPTISGNQATASGGGVFVYDGTFAMSGSAQISGNKATTYGGGVYVNGSSSTFTMSGEGVISDNTANTNGGGVYLSDGEFTMSGGNIGHNKLDISAGLVGGGVYVASGTFIMEGGSIDHNEAPSSDGEGGGVYVNDGTFTLKGTASIANNTAYTKGGGVYVYNGGSNTVFNMEGGTIKGNTASGTGPYDGGGGVYVYGTGSTFTMTGGTIGGDASGDANHAKSGGGVYVDSGASFNMSTGAIISGNQATVSGGGVYVDSTGSTFSMSGGTISGNTASGTGTSDGGGGVYVASGAFAKTGGIIHGDTDTAHDPNNDENTAASGNGHAVYVAGSPPKQRYTGAYQTDGLDSGASNGWEYIVTFNANGGTPAPAAQPVAYGDSARTPNEGTKAGYTLDGWYTEAELTNLWNFANAVTADMTLYAKWTAITYTVTFNANGGDPAPGTQTITHGGTVTEPPAMTKTGYDFGGWFQEADFTTPWNFAGDTVTADMTLYTKWTYIFATAANYRTMAALSGGTVNGSTAYNTPSNDPGAFPAGRTVTLNAFKMATYETTYELWYEVKGWATSQGYTFANQGREGHNGTDGDAPTTDKTEPVTTINWRDAIVWCNAYSEMSGKAPVYYYSDAIIKDSRDTNATACDSAVMDTTKSGYRLPTEAEWEYAARGGTPGAGAFADKWPGTNVEGALGTYAWYDTNSGSATHPVGGKAANSVVLYDMSGNVYEWCWDWDDTINNTETVTDPTGPEPSENRVIRGGSWDDSASECGVASRSAGQPYWRDNICGFRVVCVP